jgi:hypothetical protein
MHLNLCFILPASFIIKLDSLHTRAWPLPEFQSACEDPINLQISSSPLA